MQVIIEFKSGKGGIDRQGAPKRSQSHSPDDIKITERFVQLIYPDNALFYNWDDIHQVIHYYHENPERA